MAVTIQITPRGTMTLPKPLRKTLGVDKGGVVMASTEGGGPFSRTISGGSNQPQMPRLSWDRQQ